MDIDTVFKNIKDIQDAELTLNGSKKETKRHPDWYLYTVGKGECETPGCRQRYYGSGPYCYYCGKVAEGLCERTEYYEGE